MCNYHSCESGIGSDLGLSVGQSDVRSITELEVRLKIYPPEVRVRNSGHLRHASAGSSGNA
jgi:hypothetical protein